MASGFSSEAQQARGGQNFADLLSFDRISNEVDVTFWTPNFQIDETGSLISHFPPVAAVIGPLAKLWLDADTGTPWARFGRLEYTGEGRAEITEDALAVARQNKVREQVLQSMLRLGLGGHVERQKASDEIAWRTVRCDTGHYRTTPSEFNLEHVAIIAVRATSPSIK